MADKKKLKKITAWYKSRQDLPKGKEIKYKAERHRDGLYTCFCQGDVYGVQKGVRCWHVKRLKVVAIKVDSDGKYDLPKLEREDYTEGYEAS